MSERRVVYQLTDTHLFDPAVGGAFNSIDTNASFCSVLGGAACSGKPDLVVVSGDLSHDRSAGSYEFLSERINAVFGATVPCLVQAGNHDEAEQMALFFPHRTCSMARWFRLDNWLIYLLDSNGSTKHHWIGHISDQSLEELSAAAAMDGVEHLLVFMHHNAVAVPHRNVECSINNADALFKRINEIGIIRCISSGHVHQSFHVMVSGILYTSASPTGFQSHDSNGEKSYQRAGFKRFGLRHCGLFEADTISVASPVPHYPHCPSLARV